MLSSRWGSHRASCYLLHPLIRPAQAIRCLGRSDSSAAVLHSAQLPGTSSRLNIAFAVDGFPCGVDQAPDGLARQPAAALVNGRFATPPGTRHAPLPLPKPGAPVRARADVVDLPGRASMSHTTDRLPRYDRLAPHAGGAAALLAPLEGTTDARYPTSMVPQGELDHARMGRRNATLCGYVHQELLLWLWDVLLFHPLEHVTPCSPYTATACHCAPAAGVCSNDNVVRVFL